METTDKNSAVPVCVCSNGSSKAAACEKCYLDFFGGLPLRPTLNVGESQLVYNYTHDSLHYSCVVKLIERTDEFDTVDCQIQNIPRVEQGMTVPLTMRAAFYKNGTIYDAVRPDPMSHFDGPRLLMAVAN